MAKGKRDLAENMKIYFSIRDTLSGQDGVILKGERTFISKTMRNEVEDQLHSNHLGFDSMMRRARETVFWASLRKGFRQLADNCTVCK